MTKLVEWLSVFGVLFTVWYSLVTNKVENSFSRDHPQMLLYSPLIFILIFGLYALTVVLYRTFTFTNCEEAAEELKKEIEEAKADLTKLGFVFPEQIKRD